MSINEKIKNWNSYQYIYYNRHNNRLKYMLIFIMLAFVVFLFLPWTQSITAKGNVTAFNINERTQQLNSVISGAIEKWYIKEGDFVKAGDTILKLTEVKTEYLDPALLENTRQQLIAKQDAATNYSGKAGTAVLQKEALLQARDFKIEQINNKIEQAQRYIEIDNANLAAAKNDYEIAKLQYERQQTLFNEGLVSKTQMEQRNQALQNAQAKYDVAQRKLANSKQELIIAKLEKSGTEQDYQDKLAKVEGEKFQSLSNVATAKGDAAKLSNQYTNYESRAKFYYLIAPQDGQVIKVKNAGVGEIIKESEFIAEVVPNVNNRAVEMYIKAVDIPLISLGQRVSLTFDGYPAIVFSGWPNASFGFFRGKVTVIESAINKQGYFRILITEDASYKIWPQNLRYGTGSNGIALLKDVPIYYEIWRKINGFPPDYYQVKTVIDNKQKKDESE
ncbi:MAG: HlyD family efflux transporter periplasmic adaptor subunit [Sphingobacteriales bacterium]|nr:HlyD family efflux transporter periplasmic adaptor subunit [Sphingobacteriales bacterium]